MPAGERSVNAEAREAYLKRLGLRAEPASAEALFRIHRRQVERIPYETLWIPLGESCGIDPTECSCALGPAARVGTASISTARLASFSAASGTGLCAMLEVYMGLRGHRSRPWPTISC